MTEFEKALPPFTEAWAKKEAEGYRYNGDALENVEFGYAIAQDELASLSTKAAPVSDGVVERVARALFPNEWHEIDRRRKAAQCYRDTPHEKAGFESPEAAEKFASEYEAAADRSAEWALGIAARGLKASGLDEAIEALEACLAREKEWAAVRGMSDCTCITLSRDGEREYETGMCPHQRARTTLDKLRSAL